MRLFRRSRAREYDPYKLATPQIYLWRMIVFLILAGFLALILFRQAYDFFLSNPVLNGAIIAVLVIGVLLSFRQVLRLYPEIRWVNTFRSPSPGSSSARRCSRPDGDLLGDRIGRMAISTSTGADPRLIQMRLDEDREMSRYLVNLLIFLGLLGTLWAPADREQGQRRDHQPRCFLRRHRGDLENLKTSLQGPLAGMGTAFSASLFGLSGSLILGFLDLQAGQGRAPSTTTSRIGFRLLPISTPSDREPRRVRDHRGRPSRRDRTPVAGHQDGGNGAAGRRR